MRVILCGYNWSGCKALELLLSRGHEVFVFTHESPAYVPSVIEFCEKRKVSYSTENISTANLPFAPEIICSIYYRHLIQKPVINICHGKIFNLHPSLLPKYRGCSSLTWAMINGETETGFSYHYIDEGCDTGSILLQKSMEIEEWDTQQTLYQRVMFESMSYFEAVFELVKQGAAGEPQTNVLPPFKRGCPHGGVIDSSWDFPKVERFIRAMNHPPLPPARFEGVEITTIADYRKYVAGRKVDHEN